MITFNPLAGSLLSGNTGTAIRLRRVAFRRNSADLGRHEREFETVAGVQEIAKQHGTLITTLSVAWVLANPAITSVILGTSRVEQLTDTVAAADYKLDISLKTRLDEASIEFRRGDAGK